MRTFLAGFAIVSASLAMADEPPKKLSAIDLAVQTHKWDGKVVQTTAQCFYADVDEYRCAIGASGNVFVRVDFAEIEPPEIKKAIEDNCDTIQKMMTRNCSFQVTFTYMSNDWEEQNSGSVMMLIEAQDNKGTFIKAKR
jgi:hypothetical protein